MKEQNEVLCSVIYDSIDLFVYFKKNEDKDLLMYLMPMKKVKDADFTNER